MLNHNHTFASRVQHQGPVKIPDVHIIRNSIVGIKHQILVASDSAERKKLKRIKKDLKKIHRFILSEL
jgi:hypothetical protein